MKTYKAEANYKPAKKFPLAHALIDFWLLESDLDDPEWEIYPATVKRYIVREDIWRHYRSHPIPSFRVAGERIHDKFSL